MHKKIVFFFLPVIFLSNLIFSQDFNFQLDVITHMNTASQFRVENNKIYAATTGGLLIYTLDNDKFQTYNSVDGIYNHYLTAIAKTKYNQLVLGSLKGYLTFFDAETKTVTNDENLKGTEIVDITAIEDSLWVLSKDFVSVYLYDQDQKVYRFRESYQEFGTSVGEFRAIEYANGRIWLANETGLVSAPGNFLKYNLYAGSNWRVQTTAQGLPGNTINDIVKGGSGEIIYLATNRGLSKYDFNSFTNIINGLIAPSLQHLALRDGEIYVAESRRVYKLVSVPAPTPTLRILRLIFIMTSGYRLRSGASVILPIPGVSGSMDQWMIIWGKCMLIKTGDSGPVPRHWEILPIEVFL
jgi:hypothetical protein